MTTAPPAGSSPASGRPDVFISYAREDEAFVSRVVAALGQRGKETWVDVDDIRAGASDWRGNVWAGIEAAKVVLFVLTPHALSSRVCSEELERASELNKRLIPLLHDSVEGKRVPPALEKPNWIYTRAEDDFDRAIDALVTAIETDEAWIEAHARLTQRTAEWLQHERDGSYLLRGSDLVAAERWLDDQGSHAERPTAEQIAYVNAGRRAAAQRQRRLLLAAGVALAVTVALAVVALFQRAMAIDRKETALAQARAAQAIAAVSRDPEESLEKALEAVSIKPNELEARYALRLAVGRADWTALMRIDPRPRAGEPASPLFDGQFAPNGRLVAFGGEDHRVATRSVTTGQGVELVGHACPIKTAVFSPDSRRLVTASGDGSARVWNPLTGRVEHVLDTKSGDVSTATYGAGGRLVATVNYAGARNARTRASTRDRRCGARGAERELQVWDATSGKRVAVLESRGDQPGAMKLSLDGRHALTPGAHGDAWLWDVATHLRVATLRGDGAELSFALFSADGRRVLTIYDDSHATVWATADGTRTARLPARSAATVTDTDISSDGRRVVTAWEDGRAVVTEVGAGRRRILARFRNGASLSTAQFDRTGRYVVTGDDAGVARVWQVGRQRAIRVLRGHTAAIRRARFSADGTYVLTVSDDGTARLWRTLPVTPTDPRWHHALSTTFSPDSRHVLVVSSATRGGVWDTKTGAVLRLRGAVYSIERPSWPCGRAAGCSPWSPDGRLVGGVDVGGRAVVWDAQTGAIRQRMRWRSALVSSVAFSPDGHRLALVDRDRKRVAIWNLATGGLERAKMPRRAGDTIVSARFVSDPLLRVLTVDFAGAAQLSDAATGRFLASLGETQSAAVAARADGRQIAVGTIDGRLLVLSSSKDAPRSRSASADGRVESVAYDPTGTAIATGGQRGTLRVWDSRTLVDSPLQAPDGPVRSVAFSRDSSLVLATSEGVTRIWDRRLRRVVLDLPRTPDATAEFSPDGRQIAIAGESLLEVRPCDVCASLDELRALARSRLPAS